MFLRGGLGVFGGDDGVLPGARDRELGAGECGIDQGYGDAWSARQGGFDRLLPGDRLLRGGKGAIQAPERHESDRDEKPSPSSGWKRGGEEGRHFRRT